MPYSSDSFHLNNKFGGVFSLRRLLREIPEVAVAISGGVDSMTLAFLANRWLGNKRVSMFHAVSPAVPSEATKRVVNYGKKWDWQLSLVDAGEFDDPSYIRNPVNRCFFCKKNLYSRIASTTDFQILSGANTDDLKDYRPGLDAARLSEVRHPFIESGIDKRKIRKIARKLGLTDLSELPSSPCLSSRMQTGVKIIPSSLRLIAKIEGRLRGFLPHARSVRCRFLKSVIELQIDAEILEAMSLTMRADITKVISEVVQQADETRPIRMAAYVRGSAFVHGANND